jgi:hypothetical protein
MLKKLFALSVLGLLLAGQMYAQVSFTKAITFTCGTGSATVTLGVNPANTFGQDNPAASGGVSEPPAPPAPPAPFVIDARFKNASGFPTWGSTGAFYDVRGYTSATQVDSFRVVVSSEDGTNSTALTVNPLVISWPADIFSNASSWTIRVQQGSTVLLNTTSMTGTSVSIPAIAPAAPDPVAVNVTIVKIGAVQAVAVGFSAADVAFGSSNVGGPYTANLVVSNPGSSSNLSISAINVAGLASPFGITLPSLPATVAPGASVSIPVTFTPSASGSFSGTVVFTHNAAGSPTTVNVTGTAVANAGQLKFVVDAAPRLDGYSYTDTVALDYASGAGLKMRALQFSLRADHPIVLNSIQKLSPIADSKWVFRSRFFRSTSASDPTDSTVVDSVIVTLYAADTTVWLAAGNNQNLFSFNYNVDRFDEPDSMYRKLMLTYVAASDFQGTNLGVTGSSQYVKLYNTTLRGDVNNDGRVDVIDLMMVVDHILKRITLSGDQFMRANVAPWNSPDGVINAQDLAVLQYMILTGTDPSGITLNKIYMSEDNKLHKVNNYDAEVTFHVTAAGVAVRVTSDYRVKGMQFDVMGMANAPTSVQSTLGVGYYNENTERLRILVYDSNGASLDPGTNLIANIPVRVDDYTKLSVDRVVLGTDNNMKLSNLKINITNQEAPEVPATYSLKQNYPNPFNPTTDIQFSVPQSGDVKIAVYNVLGQEVRTLFAGVAERGTRIVRWDGRNNAGNLMPSGMYIYKMTAGSFSEARKMMLLK